jgi:hypothetical protein
MYGKRYCGPVPPEQKDMPNAVGVTRSPPPQNVTPFSPPRSPLAGSLSSVVALSLLGRHVVGSLSSRACLSTCVMVGVCLVQFGILGR